MYWVKRNPASTELTTAIGSAVETSSGSAGTRHKTLTSTDRSPTVPQLHRYPAEGRRSSASASTKLGLSGTPGAPPPSHKVGAWCLDGLINSLPAGSKR